MERPSVRQALRCPGSFSNDITASARHERQFGCQAEGNSHPAEHCQPKGLDGAPPAGLDRTRDCQGLGELETKSG
jgi:hypothetical protein